MIRVSNSSVVLSLVTLLLGCGPPQDDSHGVEAASQDQVIAVPEGMGRPVLIDGVFTPGEWDDALHLPVDEVVTLHFKQVHDHVFVGASTTGLSVPVVDLFLQGEDGPVFQFHASAQLGERILADEGQEDPAFQWGATSDWYANEVRYDGVVRDSLEAATGDRWAAIELSVFSYDGFEMQFRRSKLPGARWRMRVEVAGGPDYGSPTVFPAGTERKVLAGWAVLALTDHGGL